MNFALCEVLEQKKSLWEEYYRLVLEQQKLLKSKAIDELQRVLDRKDELIKRLEDTERQWEALLKEGTFDDGLWGFIEELKSELYTLIKRAWEAEKTSLEMAEGFLACYKSKLSGLQQARELIHAYHEGEGLPVLGAFLDKSR
ncbi:MAG: flagellar protein FlgN [Thermanaeromonas sp.]|uniref:flagellar export chaperone FlgN n=1 Tax=Thermanaeromonas sp. TaxID=2003697 RepID=UPI00243844A9|nr:flagellar export chaperone FlgN [Thermanaeromonas sp.]MCG0278384.1 flagellar protein FlgN [Thermanaeromonas sp.]